MESKIQEGEIAPDFKLKSDEDKEFSLKDFKGKNVVLYFYPKDNTPGCTTQAVDFTENLEKFTKLNTIVIGVSKDSTDSHKKFKEKKNLNVILLSDEDLQMMPDYGVWTEKNTFGKKYMGIERSTFLIDQEGKIVKIWRKVKVKNHFQDVLNEIEKI